MGVTAGRSFVSDGRKLWLAAPSARRDRISRADRTLQVENCAGSCVEDRLAPARKLQTDPRGKPSFSRFQLKKR